MFPLFRLHESPVWEGWRLVLAAQRVKPIERVSRMSTEDRYNGWANRETWALNLWLSNDAGLYEMTRERVADAVSHSMIHAMFATTGETTDRHRERVAGETVKALWEELTDDSDDEHLGVVTTLAMIREVGSAWRIDWDEIGAAWLPEDGE